jgi:hypothetical protein
MSGRVPAGTTVIGYCHAGLEPRGAQAQELQVLSGMRVAMERGHGNCTKLTIADKQAV